MLDKFSVAFLIRLSIYRLHPRFGFNFVLFESHRVISNMRH